MKNEFIILLISSIITVCGWIYNSYVERKRKKLEDIRRNNSELYTRIITTLMSFVWGKEMSDKKLNTDVKVFLVEVTPHLMAWGGDAVVKKFSEFRTYSIDKPGDPEGLISCFHDLIIEIRRELGHKSLDIKKDLRKLYINE